MNEKMIKEVIKVSDNSYSPVTNFCVGAVLETENGNIYTGVNVETPSTIFVLCAERTAFVKALSEGERSFKRIYIYGHKRDKDATRAISPCGMCLQVMNELCNEDFEIIMVKSETEYEVHTLKEFLPFSFVKKK